MHDIWFKQCMIYYRDGVIYENKIISQLFELITSRQFKEGHLNICFALSDDFYRYSYTLIENWIPRSTRN